MNSTHHPLQAFAFDSQAVRVIHKDNEPWFVAKDVCACLGIENHRNAVAKLDADEKDGVQTLDAIGRQQETTVVNESGLYAIILRSQGAMTPGTPAHTFRKWVTAEVLPSIRKTGHYAAPGAVPTDARDARIDKLLEVMEQVVTLIPQMLRSGTGRRGGGGQPRKVMQKADVAQILTLRAAGYKLADLVAETGFSQSQVFAVLNDRYRVLPSGRVSIDLRSDFARAADKASRADRTAPLFD